MASRYIVLSTFDGFWLVVDSYTDTVVTKFVKKTNAFKDCERRNKAIK